MARIANHSESATRQQLLQAALKSFSQRGYAATSVQDIVDAARVSKPALYYYFQDKADLFQALIDWAHEDRYRLMQEAAARGRTVAEKLEHLVAEVFDFSQRHEELMRLAYATAFASSGETPGRAKCLEKGRRNFEFVRDLIRAGQGAGELNRRFSADELTMGIYGQMNFYLMVRLLADPQWPLDRRSARQIVRLFLEGAAARKRSARRSAGSRMGRLLHLNRSERAGK